jgi:hypothetical protein
MLEKLASRVANTNTVSKGLTAVETEYLALGQISRGDKQEQGSKRVSGLVRACEMAEKSEFED